MSAVRTWLLERAATTRLVLAATCAWVAAVVPVHGWAPVVAALLCTLAAALLLLRRAVRARGLLAWVLSVGLLAAAVSAGVWTARTVVPDAPGEYAGEATVLTDPVTGPSGAHRAQLRTAAGPVTVISREPLPPAGSRVHVTGRIEPEGAAAALFADAPLTVLEEPGPAWRLRAEVRGFLARCALGEGADGGAAALGGARDHDGAGLLPGLVVGDVEGLAPGLEEDMRTVSLAHLTAVSGSNISIVALGVMWTVRRTGAGRGWAIGAAVVVTTGYVFVVGPEPSVIRAAGMGLVGAIVLLRGTGTRGPAVLASAVIGVIVLRPALAGEPGFHLSVAATAALVLLGPGLTELLQARRVPYPVAAALAVPITAQIGVTPVLLGIGGTLSAWAVPANVLAAPLVAPATLLGMLVLAFGLLAAAAAGPVLAAIELCGSLLALPATGCAWWIARLARVGTELPAAVWPWPTGALGIVLAAVAALGLALAVLLRLGAGPAIGAAVLVLCLLAGTLLPVVHRRVPADWQVLVCDVGQGSATLVRLGAEQALLIDTGPDSATVDSCLSAAEIREVQLLVSHFDADHVAGHPGVVRGRSLTAIQFPAGAGGHRRARALLGAHPGVPVTEVEAGARFSAGRASWEILWPPAGSAGTGSAVTGTAPDGSARAGGTADDDAAEDTNASSAVVLVTVPGLTVLVPGDIGEAEQRRLARTVPPVDVLLAPHHGSSDLSPEFYTAAAPRLGVVSVGEDNGYGHPSAGSLAAFGTAPVLRTDECGTLALTPGPRVAAAGGGARCPV
ncbi:ComEC/Rec2 family competence protein [Brevibacterium pityocampae]|uniref:Metallo-beta-lactamase domain-containing protein n=1 Tax=Brevibacterium pityocampae TaxID=506594 RepID=A0ABP8JNW5_9MICO